MASQISGVWPLWTNAYSEPCPRFLFIFDVRFVFASNRHDSGVLTDTEWYMYCDWHTFLTDTLPVKLDGIVYLRTDPKVF